MFSSLTFIAQQSNLPSAHWHGVARQTFLSTRNEHNLFYWFSFISSLVTTDIINDSKPKKNDSKEWERKRKIRRNTVSMLPWMTDYNLILTMFGSHSHTRVNRCYALCGMVGLICYVKNPLRSTFFCSFILLLLNWIGDEERNKSIAWNEECYGRQNETASSTHSIAADLVVYDMYKGHIESTLI